MRSSLAVAAIAVVLVVAAAGCGGGQAAPNVASSVGQQLLERPDVARYPPGTPARALLEWWRSAQFADTTGFRQEYVPGLRAAMAADPHAPDALNYFAGAIRNARPQILNVVTRAGRATVYAMIVYHQPIGSSRYITSTVPRAFTFERVGARWLLADDSFVQTALPAFLRRRAS